MPTYDYKCNSCEEVFEKFHGISETPQVACPSCGKDSRKIIGVGAGIMFKGSGFYTTDYKKSGSQESSSAPAKHCTTGSCGCG